MLFSFNDEQCCFSLFYIYATEKADVSLSRKAKK
jgi:hypothetical protein